MIKIFNQITFSENRSTCITC